MKTRKIVKTIMPVIVGGTVSGVGQSILGGVMPNSVAKTATQSVLGATGPILGLGALSSLTKEFDKGFARKKRR
jgi:hypothetical protein